MAVSRQEAARRCVGGLRHGVLQGTVRAGAHRGVARAHSIGPWQHRCDRCPPAPGSVGCRAPFAAACRCADHQGEQRRSPCLLPDRCRLGRGTSRRHSCDNASAQVGDGRQRHSDQGPPLRSAQTDGKATIACLMTQPSYSACRSHELVTGSFAVVQFHVLVGVACVIAGFVSCSVASAEVVIRRPGRSTTGAWQYLSLQRLACPWCVGPRTIICSFSAFFP